MLEKKRLGKVVENILDPKSYLEKLNGICIVLNKWGIKGHNTIGFTIGILGNASLKQHYNLWKIPKGWGWGVENPQNETLSI